MGFHALPYCRWHRYYRRQTYSSCSLPWLEAGSPTLQTPPAHLPRFSLHPGIGIRIHSAATSYNRGYLVGKGTGQPVLKAPRSSHRSCPQQRMDGWMRLAFRALQLSPHTDSVQERQGREGISFQDYRAESEERLHCIYGHSQEKKECQLFGSFCSRESQN